MCHELDTSHITFRLLSCEFVTNCEIVVSFQQILLAAQSFPSIQYYVMSLQCKYGGDGVCTDKSLSQEVTWPETNVKTKTKMFSAIVNKGTDEEFLITGYRRSWIRTILSLVLSILLGGIPLLVAKWKPDWRLFFTSVQCRLKSATRLM